MELEDTQLTRACAVALEVAKSCRLGGRARRKVESYFPHTSIIESRLLEEAGGRQVSGSILLFDTLKNGQRPMRLLEIGAGWSKKEILSVRDCC